MPVRGGVMVTCPICGGRGYWDLIGPDNFIEATYQCDQCNKTGKVTEEKAAQMSADAERLKQRMLDTVKDWMDRN